MQTRFKSKIDWWLGLLLLLLPIGAVVPVATLYLNNDPSAYLGWISVIIMAVIYGGLLFPLYYELEAENVLIRFGLVRIRIPYQKIKKVVPTRSILSSPALSLDRLHIDTAGMGAMISPKNKQEFLQELAKKTDHLQLTDDKLLPK